MASESTRRKPPSPPGSSSSAEVVVFGASAGGFEALQRVLGPIEPACPLRLAVVRHLHPESDSSMVEQLGEECRLPTREITDKMAFEPGIIHIAPANYHVVVEEGASFALLTDQRINYARPSIDLLFQTAAEVFREHLTAVLLSGAGSDGCAGLLRVRELGGRIVVQEPGDAIMPALPVQAIRLAKPELILDADGIADLLIETAR